MSTRIGEEIYKYQNAIQEFQKVKLKINRSDGKKVRFIIETKHWYGYAGDGFLSKERSNLDIDKSTMEFLINTAIENLEQEINKIIDCETELRTKEKVEG